MGAVVVDESVSVVADSMAVTVRVGRFGTTITPLDVAVAFPLADRVSARQHYLFWTRRLRTLTLGVSGDDHRVESDLAGVVERRILQIEDTENMVSGWIEVCERKERVL